MTPTVIVVGFWGFFLAGFVLIIPFATCIENICYYYFIYVFGLLKYFLNFVSTIYLLYELSGNRCSDKCGDGLQVTEITKALVYTCLAEFCLDILLTIVAVVATCCGG